MDGAKKSLHESIVVKDVKNPISAPLPNNFGHTQTGKALTTTGNSELASFVVGADQYPDAIGPSDMNTNFGQKQNYSNGDGHNNNKLSENHNLTHSNFGSASGNLGKVNNNNNNNNNSTANYNKIVGQSSGNYQLQQQQQQPQLAITTTNMPKNEPVKLVYPAVSGTQVIGGTNNTVQQQSGGTTVLNMNNRIAYTTTTLPNGTISLSHQQQNLLQQSTGVKTSIQSQQQPTLIIKNQAGSTAGVISSSSPGIYTMTKTINNQAGQNMQMPANVQIVNMTRPGGPQNQNQPKIVGLSPRVVLSNPQIVGQRPQNAGQQITLSTIQNLQHSQTGSTLLLKSESGQLQLLRIGPAPNSNQMTPNMSTGNQTIRLQTVPAPTSSSGGTIYVNTTSAQQQVYTTSQAQIVTTPVATTTTNAVPALTTHHLTAQQQQQIQHLQQSSHNSGQTVVLTNTTAPTLAVQQPQAQQVVQQQVTPTPANRSSLDNSKEKCRKFLTNLIELSKREPKPVERNVRTLIQELVDARVEPEEFCERLERLLNASPQPCLIGFLKKSLPLLRQSLVTKEIVIEGINPPAASVAFSTITTSNIPAQIRPIGQTGTVGQTQIRMITQQTVPPTKVGQTTIRQTTPINRIQAPQIQQQPQPRLSALSQIRPTQTLVQTQQGPQLMTQQPTLISSQPPALHPVSSNIITSQIRTQAASTTITRPQTTVQIRTTTPVVRNASGGVTVAATSVVKNANQANQNKSVAQIKQTQFLQKVDTSSNNTILNSNSTIAATSSSVVSINQNSNSNNNNQKIATASTAATTLLTTNNVVVVNNHSNSNSSNVPNEPKSHATTLNNKTIKSQSAAKKHALANAEKKSVSAAATAATSFYQPSSVYGDDDINDVAAMGGVNLAEETQKILGSTEFVGVQIRSCKDEVCLNLPVLQNRIRAMVAKHGLEEPSGDVAALISHACQERLKNILEKLAIIAEHRIDVIKMDPRYEVTKDVRGQIKFLEELDKAEQKRHEEQEREMLMRAAKSRSKTEDPEQAKLKAKAKELQRAEMEELRQRDANLTALQAIGPRKKPKLENDTTTASVTGTSGTGNGVKTTTPLRPRIKRVNLRDMLFYLEQEKETCRSTMLHRAYLK